MKSKFLVRYNVTIMTLFGIKFPRNEKMLISRIQYLEFLRKKKLIFKVITIYLNYINQYVVETGVYYLNVF